MPREDVKADFNQQWTSFCFEKSTVTCNAKKINEFLTLKKPCGSVISGRGWLGQSKDIYRKLLADLFNFIDFIWQWGWTNFATILFATWVTISTYKQI